METHNKRGNRKPNCMDEVMNRVKSIRTEKFCYVVCALILSILSNPFQQAVNYAAALDSQSQDLTPRVAISSHNLIYVIIHALSETAITPRQISFLINFSLLFLMLNGLGTLFSLLGFTTRNCILMSVFSISTYTFATPISYEVQIWGPITQARVTPILVLYVLNSVSRREKRNYTIKIAFLIGVSLWVHLVIGVFLAAYVLLMSWKVNSNKKFLNPTFISTTVITILFLALYKSSKITQVPSVASINWIESAIKNPFCLHYTNILNMFSSLNNSRSLFALFSFFGATVILNLRINVLRTLEGNTETLQVREKESLDSLKNFYYIALVTSIILNLALLKPNLITNYALGAMPFRFLDAANLFTFSILVFSIKKLQGERILLPVLSVLILGRIINARILDFRFRENEVHFFILFIIVIILYVLNRSNIEIKIDGIARVPEGILAILTVAFLLIQLHHETQKPEINWDGISKTNSITGFAGSTILTSPEVRFPVGVTKNTELLSHSELQSILYVPESTSYVEANLRKYYSTNLNEYFSGHSCALSGSANIRKSWEDRSQSEWRKLAQDDNFSFIIVPDEWKMQMKPLRTLNLFKTQRQSRVSIYKP